MLIVFAMLASALACVPARTVSEAYETDAGALPDVPTPDLPENPLPDNPYQPDLPTPELPTPNGTLPMPDLPTPDLPENPLPDNPYLPDLPEIPEDPTLPDPKKPSSVIPVAKAGKDMTVAVNWTVQFDGSASYDANGKSLNYTWFFNWTGPLPNLPEAPDVPKPGDKPSLPPSPIDLPPWVPEVPSKPTMPSPEIPSVPQVPDLPSPSIPDIPIPPLSESGDSYSTAGGTLAPTIPDIPIPAPQVPDIPNIPIPNVPLPDVPYPVPESPIKLPDSNEVSPTHIYNMTGVYTVVLIVSNGVAASYDYLNVTVLAKINRAPTANAGTNIIANTGDVIRFDGSSSTDPDNDTLTYSWDFGDSSDPMTGVKSAHVYKKWGIYYPILTVSDGEFTDTDSIKVVVKEINVPPAADAGDNQTADVGDVVKFDGGGSSDLNGDEPMYTPNPDYIIQYYTWDFGDGGEARGMYTKHIYSAPGIYKVVLTVGDREFRGTDTVYVTVKHLSALVLSADSNNIDARAGDVIEAHVQVRNIGTKSENVSLGVEGYFSGWASIEKNYEVIDVGKSSIVGITITIPADAMQGTYDFVLTSLVGNMSKRAGNPYTVVTVSVTRGRDVSVLSDPPTISTKSGESKPFNITVTNSGGKRESLMLYVDGGELNRYITLPKSLSVDLEAGESKDVELALAMPQDMDKKFYMINVSVLAEDGSEAAATNVKVIYKDASEQEYTPGFDSAYALFAMGIAVASLTWLNKKERPDRRRRIEP